jgi:hypothetical protein
MNTEHLALLQQAPASTHDDDTWARLCCEQALLALEEGCYAVGALLVDGAGELLCSARNQVFTSTYSSAAHAEMQVLDQLESEGTNIKAINIARLWALTGCRRNEIAGLKWNEVDFDNGLLVLEDSKTGHSVRPLGTAALTLLRQIEQLLAFTSLEPVPAAARLTPVQALRDA